MTDILIVGGDVEFLDGDFSVGRSDEQAISIWLESSQGEWKQWPLLGVDVKKYLLDDAAATELRHRIAVQAEYDKCVITEVAFSHDLNVSVKGYYGT